MTARRVDSHFHVPFIVAALAFALCGGFVLAVILPLRLALGDAGSRWPAYAQVHGHLQTIGFIGLIIVGVGYRLAAAFSGKPELRYPRLIPYSLWLIGGGVILRALGQPSAAQPVFAALFVLGAAFEAVGAALVALNLVATLRGALRTDPSAQFFAAGSLWFLAQALLGLWWIIPAATAGSPLLQPVHNQLLVLLQFFGFHLLFILGVGSRSFPIFFARPKLTPARTAVPFWCIQSGLLALVVAVLLPAGSAEAFQNIGMLAVAAGIAWGAALTGWWRPPSRIRPASRPFAVTLQLALVWLTIACTVAGGSALRALTRGGLPAWLELDAVRHMLAVGVILTMIVAMAQLVLPEFASERFSGRQGAWRGPLLGALLSLATLLRVIPRFLTDQLGGVWANYLIALSGTIALSVVLVFAILFARGVRNHRALRQRFEAAVTGGQAWALESRESPPPGRSA